MEEKETVYINLLDQIRQMLDEPIVVIEIKDKPVLPNEKVLGKCTEYESRMFSLMRKLSEEHNGILMDKTFNQVEGNKKIMHLKIIHTILNHIFWGQIRERLGSFTTDPLFIRNDFIITSGKDESFSGFLSKLASEIAEKKK